MELINKGGRGGRGLSVGEGPPAGPVSNTFRVGGAKGASSRRVFGREQAHANTLPLRHLATLQQREGQMCRNHVAVALACALTRAAVNTSCESLKHVSPVMSLVPVKRRRSVPAKANLQNLLLSERMWNRLKLYGSPESSPSAS